MKAEKAILEEISHPFLVSLFWTNKDHKFLYMLFEFVCGEILYSSFTVLVVQQLRQPCSFFRR